MAWFLFGYMSYDKPRRFLTPKDLSHKPGGPPDKTSRNEGSGTVGPEQAGFTLAHIES
jgi:hypothetical protein